MKIRQCSTQAQDACKAIKRNMQQPVVRTATMSLQVLCLELFQELSPKMQLDSGSINWTKVYLRRLLTSVHLILQRRPLVSYHSLEMLCASLCAMSHVFNLQIKRSASNATTAKQMIWLQFCFLMTVLSQANCNLLCFAVVAGVLLEQLLYPPLHAVDILHREHRVVRCQVQEATGQNLRNEKACLACCL